MWDKLDRGQKLLAAIFGLGSMGAAIVGVLVGIAHYAAASEISRTVPAIEKRVGKLEDQRDGEVEWRRYLAEQVGQIAIRVGAPIAAPPSIAINPKESR